MQYIVGQQVELLRNGEWYRGYVGSINAVSASGRRCYKIVFEKDNPAGTSSSMQTIHYSYKLIPIEDAKTWLRPYPSEAIEEAVGGGGADAHFKNSVNIRF